MDSLSPRERSERMSRVKGRDTRPERVVRRIVTSLGFRYRLSPSGVPGRPDLVFHGRRKVIFVHGCFWHRHSDCHLARLPKSRTEFWHKKLEGNRERDERNLAQLQADGWASCIVWECELRWPDVVARRIENFLGRK